MSFPLFLEKHVVEGEYTNRLYKPFHFLIVVFGSVSTQGPVVARSTSHGSIFLSRDGASGNAGAVHTSACGGRGGVHAAIPCWNTHPRSVMSGRRRLRTLPSGLALFRPADFICGGLKSG